MSPKPGVGGPVGPVRHITFTQRVAAGAERAVKGEVFTDTVGGLEQGGVGPFGAHRDAAIGALEEGLGITGVGERLVVLTGGLEGADGGGAIAEGDGQRAHR